MSFRPPHPKSQSLGNLRVDLSDLRDIVQRAERQRDRTAAPIHMDLATFGAGPVAPPTPPAPPLHKVIAAARKADARTYGRADLGRVIGAVVGQLDPVQAMEIVLDPTFSTQWKRAAVVRLGELKGSAA
jgi:hypothetical protein